MTTTVGRYGWLPDLPDQRDKLYYKVSPPFPIPPLPAFVDLRPACSPIENQGELGSCTANALAGVIEFLERKDKVVYQDVSRLFIYYNERAMENTIASDAGAIIRDGIKSLVSKGVCDELLWPYDVSKFTDAPTTQCYEQATTHKVTAYERLETLRDMRTCLAAGFPFVFGFTVYSSFESDAVASTGTVPMPQSDESVLGGHAVCGVGYDDKEQTVLCRNSWGTSWGMSGYFTLPYAYVASRSLSDDFWTIRRESGF
jgi:C1A family cysteine protease